MCAEGVGGRIATDRGLGIALDLGAAWIHGPSGNPLTAIAKSIDAPTFVTDDESVIVFGQDGQPVDEDTMDGVDHQTAHCICTLPLGVLKAGDVAFEPPLTGAFAGAISRLGVGHVNKVALRFASALR